MSKSNLEKDQSFIEIRPELDLDFAGDKNPLEMFMHVTLRPILKLQHEKIELLINNSEGFRKEKCQSNDETKNFNYLKDYLAKNSKTKQQLIGCIIGIFTDTELNYFFENKKDVSKRISEMITVRYLSTLN